ncbi:unnamed protein product, partial [Cyprideis torosa]
MSAQTDTFNVLVMCTGSVATIKLEELLTTLKTQWSEHSLVRLVVKVAITSCAAHFLEAEVKQKIQEDGIELLEDKDEWKWKNRADPVLHIELRKWADVGLIAPLSANSLAKISVGICDNLVTSVVRAWDRDKPLLFAPAMNTHMFKHPVTQPQITTLQNWGYVLIPPVEKKLICGDSGLGAMGSVADIVEQVIAKAKRKKEVAQQEMYKDISRRPFKVVKDDDLVAFREILNGDAARVVTDSETLEAVSCDWLRSLRG